MEYRLETALLSVEAELEELARAQAVIADRWSYVAEAWAAAEKSIGPDGNQLVALHIRRKQKAARTECTWRAHGESAEIATELRELRTWIKKG